MHGEQRGVATFIRITVGDTQRDEWQCAVGICNRDRGGSIDDGVTRERAKFERGCFIAFLRAVSERRDDDIEMTLVGGDVEVEKIAARRGRGPRTTSAPEH